MSRPVSYVLPHLRAGLCFYKLYAYYSLLQAVNIRAVSAAPISAEVSNIPKRFCRVRKSL